MEQKDDVESSEESELEEEEREIKRKKSSISYTYKGKQCECLSEDFRKQFFVRMNPHEVQCTYGCTKLIKSTEKNGCGNVKAHLMTTHPGWEKIMYEKSKPANTMLSFVRAVPPKLLSEAKEWFHWISLDFQCLPFNIVEDPYFRAFRGSDFKFSRRKLKRILVHLGEKVMRKIRKTLPKHFGLLHDGWDAGNGTHLTALFASYLVETTENAGNTKQQRIRRLLSLSPLLDETNYSAESHADTINEKLWSFFAINIDNENPIQYVTADNVSVNYKLARLLGVPMIGCFSHRLNLCMKEIYEVYRELIRKYNAIMIAIANCKTKMGIINEKNYPKPVKCNSTRWTSTYASMSRSVDLFDYLGELFDEEEECYRAVHPRDKRALIMLRDSLKPFFVLTKSLQYDTQKPYSLAVAREWFRMIRLEQDHMVKAFGVLYPEDEKPKDLYPGRYLVNTYDNGTADHAHVNVDFQNALEKIQTNREAALSPAEIKSLEKFRKSAAVLPANSSNMNPFEAAQKNMQSLKTNGSAYIDTDLVDVTSDTCERLFSRARLMLHYLRKSMTPESIELVLYLWANSDLWDENTILEILLEYGNFSEVEITAATTQEEFGDEEQLTLLGEMESSYYKYDEEN
jgi:hypothetical protein